MRRRFALALALSSIVLTSLPAAAQAPGSAAWLLKRVADQAEVEARAAAEAGRAKDAQTWRAWEAIYRKDALLPNVQPMSGLQVTAVLAKSDVDALPAARAEGNAAKVALLEQSVRLWNDLHAQLEHGGAVQVHFPEQAMLTPVAGVEGTPWSPPPLKATASDCRAIAQNARSCEAELGQLQHHNMMGLGSDQSDYAVVRLQQCHRWEEAYVAYCRGR